MLQSDAKWSCYGPWNLPRKMLWNSLWSCLVLNHESAQNFPPRLETPLASYRIGFGPLARNREKKKGETRKRPPPENRKK